jgi:hypothetical protein
MDNYLSFTLYYGERCIVVVAASTIQSVSFLWIYNTRYVRTFSAKCCMMVEVKRLFNVLTL